MKGVLAAGGEDEVVAVYASASRAVNDDRRVSSRWVDDRPWFVESLPGSQYVSFSLWRGEGKEGVDRGFEWPSALLKLGEE